MSGWIAYSLSFSSLGILRIDYTVSIERSAEFFGEKHPGPAMVGTGKPGTIESHALLKPGRQMVQAYRIRPLLVLRALVFRDFKLYWIYNSLQGSRLTPPIAKGTLRTKKKPPPGFWD